MTVLWETRYHREAVTGLYAIERGPAAEVSQSIKDLAKLEDPSVADNVKKVDNDKIPEGRQFYRIEVFAHFIEFELLEEDSRKVLAVLRIK